MSTRAMGTAPSNRRAEPRPAPSATLPPRRPGANAAARDRQRALLISCGMLVMAGLAVAMVLSARAPTAPQGAFTSSPDSELRTAKITYSSDIGGCSQQVFDNQTGRMVKSSQPCNTTTATTYDSNGVAIPLGTVHRLDAISKSFSGQK